MARLESQAKMGFYPTPVEVVRQIMAMLEIPSDARLLDTCCGEGEALNVLAEGLKVETYGVELDKSRFKAAKTRLDHVLWADALYEFICSKEYFSLLFLNPPYDTGDTEGDRTRIEVQFLKRHWPYLINGGVLVYIIPWASLKQAVPILAKHCRGLTILKFPEEYFRPFNQIVVVCTKGRPKQSEIDANNALFQNAVDAFFSDDTDRLLTTEDAADFPHALPLPAPSELTFRSVRLDPEQCLERLKKSSVWNRVHHQLFPADLAKGIQPLTSLREGHLAMLLASGIMNGEVVGSDGRRLVVKGSVVKGVTITTEEIEDGTKILHTDRYDITVRAICFDPPEIITIQ